MTMCQKSTTARTGWIPAVILKSAYYRYVEVDNSAAISVLGTIEDAVSSLDPEQYKKFLAMYDLYKYDTGKKCSARTCS